MADVILHHISGSGNKVVMNPKSTAKNIVINPTEVMPEGVKTVDDVLSELGGLAFEDEIEIPSATTEEIGVVQLSSSTEDEEDETKAATTAAVSKVSKESVKIEGDQTVEGMKNFSEGITLGGNTKLTSTTDASGNTTVTLDII